MNLNRTGGDYRPQGVILTSKLAVTAYQNGNGGANPGQTGQSQAFFVRKDNNYTDRQTGQTIEKQPLDIQCTTFEPAVIQMLATLEPGAKVNLVGWLEPSWRGYVADNTAEGDKFAIPDTGRKAIVSPKGRTINPDAHPYRIMDKPNVHVVDVKQVRVTELTPANAVATEQVTATGDAWADATSTPTATAVEDAVPNGDVEAAQKALVEAQAKLDAATASASDAPASSAPAAYTETSFN